MRLSVAAFFSASFWITSSHLAAAEVPAPRHRDLSIDGGLIAFGSENDGGVGLELSGLERWGGLMIGGRGEASTTLSWSRYGAGVLVGTRAGGPGFRLDLLAEGGVRGYSGVGREVLSADPGVSGIAPYIGARARTAYAFRLSKDSELAVGLEFFADDDLTRQKKADSYVQDTDQGTGQPTQQGVTHTVGTFTLGAGLTLGFTWDEDDPAPKATASSLPHH